MPKINDYEIFDTAKIAKLSNLHFSEEEAKKITSQLAETLNYVEKLNSLDTEGVEPTSQVTGLENVTREDEIKPSLSQEEALSNIPLRQGSEGQANSQHNGLFKVKAILGE